MFWLVTKKDAERIANEAAEHAVNEFKWKLYKQFGLDVDLYTNAFMHGQHVFDVINELANAIGYEKKKIGASEAKIVFVEKV